MRHQEPKRCLWCGSPALGSRTQYCSDRCKSALAHARQKGAWAEMKLYRSRDGLVIHGEHCRYAIPERRWRWATYQKWSHIKEVIEEMGYRTCRDCDPMGLHRPRGHLRVVGND